MRILLHVLKGPTSFISLRTFQGITCEIFQGFCKAMYLLEDDTQWEITLSEAVLCCSAKSLRFVCKVTGPHILCHYYRESIAEDILHSRRVE